MRTQPSRTQCFVLGTLGFTLGLLGFALGLLRFALGPQGFLDTSVLEGKVKCSHWGISLQRKPIPVLVLYRLNSVYFDCRHYHKRWQPQCQSLHHHSHVYCHYHRSGCLPRPHQVHVPGRNRCHLHLTNKHHTQVCSPQCLQEHVNIQCLLLNFIIVYLCAHRVQ